MGDDGPRNWEPGSKYRMNGYFPFDLSVLFFKLLDQLTLRGEVVRMWCPQRLRGSVMVTNNGLG